MKGVLRTRILSTNPSAPVLALALTASIMVQAGYAAEEAAVSAGFGQRYLVKVQDDNAPAVGTGDGVVDLPANAHSVSPQALESSDAAATQRLRFDVGDRVFFAPGSAELGSRARLVLSRQAHWLNAWNASVVIAGHADEGGAVEVDEQVAMTRAQAVRNRLQEEGIAAERLQVLGLGRRDPIADCREPACSAQNRRVVVHVMSTKTGGERQP